MKIERIFMKYLTYDEDDTQILHYDSFEDKYNSKKKFLEIKRDKIEATKNDLLDCLKSRLMNKSKTLRQWFGKDSLNEADEISLFECSAKLMELLQAEDRDFTEAINKFCISMLLPGSRSMCSFKLIMTEYDDYFGIERNKNIGNMGTSIEEEADSRFRKG